MQNCKILTNLNEKRSPALLCLGAHPDDIEIGCGGTLRKICSAHPGTTIDWVVFSGDGARAEEARAGAERFRSGADGGEVIVKEFRDGYFPFQGAAIKEFFEELRVRSSPDLIFTHLRSDRHQDHRAISDLTWNTWRDHTILEYEIPKWDGDLGVPNGYVPLSRAEAEGKAADVLDTFSSQAGKDWFTADTFLGLMRLRGNECRAEEGFAEAFFLRKIVLL